MPNINDEIKKVNLFDLISTFDGSLKIKKYKMDRGALHNGCGCKQRISRKNLKIKKK